MASTKPPKTPKASAEGEKPKGWSIFKPSTWQSSGGKKVKVAHQGEELQMYFHPELKRWVERGKEDEAAADPGNAPPPIMSSTSVSALTDSGAPPPPAMASGPSGSRKALSKRYVMQSNLSVSSSTSDLPSAGAGLLPATSMPSPPISHNNSFFVPGLLPAESEATKSEGGHPSASSGALALAGPPKPTFFIPAAAPQDVVTPTEVAEETRPTDNNMYATAIWANSLPNSALAPEQVTDEIEGCNGEGYVNGWSEAPGISSMPNGDVNHDLKQPMHDLPMGEHVASTLDSYPHQSFEEKSNQWGSMQQQQVDFMVPEHPEPEPMQLDPVRLGSMPDHISVDSKMSLSKWASDNSHASTQQHLHVETAYTAEATATKLAGGLHQAASGLHSKGRELLGALAGLVQGENADHDDLEEFDKAMHPHNTAKLDGPLPWELPDHLKYSDQFLSICTTWQRNNPGKLYSPDLLLAVVDEAPATASGMMQPAMDEVSTTATAYSGHPVPATAYDSQQQYGVEAQWGSSVVVDDVTAVHIPYHNQDQQCPHEPDQKTFSSLPLCMDASAPLMGDPHVMEQGPSSGDASNANNNGDAHELHGSMVPQYWADAEGKAMQAPMVEVSSDPEGGNQWDQAMQAPMMVSPSKAEKVTEESNFFASSVGPFDMSSSLFPQATPPQMQTILDDSSAYFEHQTNYVPHQVVDGSSAYFEHQTNSVPHQVVDDSSAYFEHQTNSVPHQVVDDSSAYFEHQTNSVPHQDTLHHVLDDGSPESVTEPLIVAVTQEHVDIPVSIISIGEESLVDQGQEMAPVLPLATSEAHGEDLEDTLLPVVEIAAAIPANLGPQQVTQLAGYLQQVLGSVRANQHVPDAALEAAMSLVVALEGAVAVAGGPNVDPQDPQQQQHRSAILSSMVQALATPTKGMFHDATDLQTPQRYSSTAPFLVQPSPMGVGDCAQGQAPGSHSSNDWASATTPDNSNQQQQPELSGQQLSAIRRELQEEFEQKLAAKTLELEAVYEHKLIAMRQDLEAEFQRRLDEKDAELDALREECADLQFNLDELLLCLGQESRKVTDLAQAMKDAGLDADAITIPIDELMDLPVYDEVC